MSIVRFRLLLLFFFIAVLLIGCHLKCEARDSINARSPLSDNGDTIVSAGNRFELGFFSPEGNERSSRYVGIWYYKLMPRTVVWVANRDDPLLDSCGSFGIKDDGNVKIWCGNEKIVHITSLESARTSNRTLQLLDSGNLILVDGQSGSGSPLWQSFENPTDTFLPGMKLNDNVELTSWISSTDPGKGDYTFRQDQGVYVIQKRSVVHWKSGEFGPFKTSDGLPALVNQFLSGSDQKKRSSVGNKTKDMHISFPNTSFSDNISRLVMNVSGVINYYSLDGGSWSQVWTEPQNYSSIYNFCGKFGIFNIKYIPVCLCPTGFKPVSSEDWRAGDYSDGCDRELAKCSHADKFLNISLVNVGGGPATPFDQAKIEKGCMEECLSDCDCEAYLFRPGNYSERGSVNSASKCWIWKNDLVNLHQNDNDSRINLSIRVPSLTTGYDSKAPNNMSRKGYVNKSEKIYVIVIPVIVAGVILLSCFSCILYRRRMAKQSENREATTVLFSNESERRVNDLMQENDKRIDLPFYNLDVILSATDNFSDANKLGQGGFGPVYKGMFPGGHEIAVKRLSSFSVQGIEEFLNEVVLIAKLQHRNLVRLLGYCIKGNEKILLYEYMLNRSLDAFIFDQHNRLLLDWKKRFEIILGIARGLLYLHQDSRLRIIHRDLKTSNILLDEDMNPKISDFGLARIVEGKGTEASTNKVVGTYGYMSQEYALDGKFSVKSDVFSFGVVMLEIISGKKNTGFYNPYEVQNLLGYAWRLWSEDKALDLIDPTMLESCYKSQVMKCINIGLLCVQEDPNDRPSTSTVVIMLGSESSMTLPLPTQPAFVVRRRITSTASSSSTKPDMISVNELSASIVQGR